ncbi:MAG TPA: dihydroorotase [Dehalococcoidia bacterium]|nr:dihydroorotase [Dehalococcoidia bacterium]
MTDLLIRGGRILDPSQGLDMIGNVLIREGRIAALGPGLEAEAPAIDAAGLLVCPGFVDIHCHLREPGFEHKETIETGTRAAARGGFTTVCCMPNTEPPIDSAATVEYILQAARSRGLVRVLPIGCVSKGRRGQGLAEMAELAQAGAIAFSDDGAPVADASLMRRALDYAAMLGLPIIDHCEDPALSRGGVMHEGWVATRLGLRGIPAAGEESMVARDIALAQLTGARLHIAHISTAGSVELVRRAKERGLPVTAEVTPHHLTLSHELFLNPPYDANAKVNPPLRTPEDVAACVEGLRDGTIDAIATDHAPHAIEDKLCEFDQAAFGISGLETALSLCLSLVHGARAIRESPVGAHGHAPLQLTTLIERLTIGPVRALGLDRQPDLAGLGTLQVGAPGDVTVFDPDAEWVVEPEKLASKGRNTPLAGRTLRGQVVATVYEGEIVWAETDVVR